MVQPSASSAGSSLPPPTRSLPWMPLLTTGLLGVTLSWAVLRSDVDRSADLALLTGAVLVFGAISELMQATIAPAGRVMHGVLCAVLAGLAALIPLQTDASFGWLAGLVGTYLMIKGAADIWLSMTSRATNPVWGLVLATGLGGLLLGFAASASVIRTAYPLLLLIGGVALVRGVSDTVAALRMRELTELEPLAPPVETPPAGYAAGWADFATNRRLDTAGPGRHSAEETDEAAVAADRAVTSDDLVSAGVRSAGPQAAVAGRATGPGGADPGPGPRPGPRPDPAADPGRRAGATTDSGQRSGATADPGLRASPAADPGQLGSPAAGRGLRVGPGSESGEVARGMAAGAGNRLASNSAAGADPAGLLRPGSAAPDPAGGSTTGAAGPPATSGGKSTGASRAPARGAKSAGPDPTPDDDPPRPGGGSRRRPDPSGGGSKRRPTGTG